MGYEVPLSDSYTIRAFHSSEKHTCNYNTGNYQRGRFDMTVYLQRLRPSTANSSAPICISFLHCKTHTLLTAPHGRRAGRLPNLIGLLFDVGCQALPVAFHSLSAGAGPGAPRCASLPDPVMPRPSVVWTLQMFRSAKALGRKSCTATSWTRQRGIFQKYFGREGDTVPTLSPQM